METLLGDFSEIQKKTAATGIDLELDKRFNVILETLNIGFPIDLETFDKYCVDTMN